MKRKRVIHNSSSNTGRRGDEERNEVPDSSNMFNELPSARTLICCAVQAFSEELKSVNVR